MKNNLSITIEGKKIGSKHPCFIIAEVGSNHNGNLKLAKKLIDVAKKAGADCVKFQTYTAENFCANRKKRFTYRSEGRKVTEIEFDMFKRLEFSNTEWKTLIDYCKKNKIIFMTTIQDPANLKMMKNIGLQAIKVGSDDFDHIENLKIYCKSKLPIILSKGMTDKNEFKKTISVMKKYSYHNLAIMHCVSLYPCKAEYLNINHLKFLNNKYKNIIWGFSDHSTSVLAPSIAVSLGAKIIEKHITLDKKLPGPDHWFSMDPNELIEMIKNIRFTEKSMGQYEYNLSKKEKYSKNIMRRKIVARKNLFKNQKLSKKDIDYKRSSKGELISNVYLLIGKKLNKNININQGIGIKDIISDS